MKQLEITSASPPLSHHKYYSSLFKYKEQKSLNDSQSQICIFKLFPLQSWATNLPNNRANTPQE